MRVSNFLLWQIAYAEIWVTDTLWPDFRRRDLLQAIVAYQKRDRRYGGIKPPAVALASVLASSAARSPDHRRRRVWFAPLCFFCSSPTLVVLACHECAGLARQRTDGATVFSTLAAVLPARPSHDVGTDGLLSRSTSCCWIVLAWGRGAFHWRGGTDAIASVSRRYYDAYLGLPLGSMVAIENRGAARRCFSHAHDRDQRSAQYFRARIWQAPSCPASAPRKRSRRGRRICLRAWPSPASGYGAAHRALAGACAPWWGRCARHRRRPVRVHAQRSAGGERQFCVIPGHGGILDRIDACSSQRDLYSCSSMSKTLHHRGHRGHGFKSGYRDLPRASVASVVERFLAASASHEAHRDPRIDGFDWPSALAVVARTLIALRSSPGGRRNAERLADRSPAIGLVLWRWRRGAATDRLRATTVLPVSILSHGREDSSRRFASRR